MIRSRRKGQSLVETSLILAAFLGLLLGMVTIGQTLFVRQTFADRVHEAARWGAVNTYDPPAIRNLVQYGTVNPDRGATPFMGLTASEVVVTAPGCPGAQCRVTVAIPAQGIRSTEPAESSDRASGGVPSKP
jgi:Flp pilus assembly protein TadG